MKTKSNLPHVLFWTIPAGVLRLLIALMFQLHGTFINTVLFIPSLLGFPLLINYLITPFTGMFSILLFYLISSKILSEKAAFWTTLIFAILPINAFNDVAGSSYSFYLFFILLIVLSLLNFDKKPGKIFFIISSFILAFSSASFAILLIPLVLALTLLIKFDNKNALKLSGFVMIPVVLISVLKPIGLTDFLRQDFSILNDIGITNTVNAWRGETQNTSFSKISKFIDNKYVYSLEIITSNTLAHFSSSIFFTPRIKIFGFSFTPPMEFGFIIPFFYFLYIKLKKDLSIMRYIPLILILFVPSILSQSSPDIEAIALVAPIFSLAFYLGLNAIKNKGIKNLTAGIVVFQFLFILADMFIGEGLRLVK